MLNNGSGVKINSEKTERQMVEEYISGVKSSVLMKKYGYKTKKSITDKVKKYKGKDFDFSKMRQDRKSYSLNFEKIDSPFTAYFIGLMLTDGYVQDETHFGIDLADEDCIKFISQVTGRGYKTYEATGELSKKPRHRIIFSDRENVKELARYGIVPRKSLILKGFDFLPEEEQYIPYVVRGIIDGDGSIGKTAYGKPCVRVCSGSKEFIEWLLEILRNKMYMYNLETIYERDEDSLCSISTALERNIQIFKILSYDRPFGMMRKYLNLYQ